MDLLMCGDSITANAGALAESVWPKLSGTRMLGSLGTYPIRHEAAGGQRWEWIATVSNARNARQYCSDLGTPSVVTFLFGTNDLGLKTMGELPAAFTTMWSYADDILAKWRKLGTRIFICHLPGPCDVDAAYTATGQDRAAWEYAVATANAGFDERAETIALPVAGGDWGVADCFHPAAAGYDHYSTLIASAIAGRTGRTPA